jgi:argininosuccinate lyase
MVTDLEPNVKAMKRAAGAGFATATDLADWIVRVLGKPFREAHHITGTLVAMAEGRNVPLHRLTIEDMQSVEPAINDDIFSVLTVASSVKSRTSFGGTAPANVRKQAKKWQTKLAREAAKRN